MLVASRATLTWVEGWLEGESVEIKILRVDEDRKVMEILYLDPDEGDEPGELHAASWWDDETALWYDCNDHTVGGLLELHPVAQDELYEAYEEVFGREL